MLSAVLKALQPWAGRRQPAVRAGRQPAGSAFAPGARVSHAALAGPPQHSSTVGIAVNWVARVWNEAPFVAEVPGESGWARKPGHPAEAAAAALSYYGGGDAALWHATLADLIPTGNAFWMVGRRRDGSPAAVCVPASRVTVHAGVDGTPSRYVVRRADGGESSAQPGEVWHFKAGQDPASPLLGASPLANLLRERAQENAAAEYAIGLCRGYGAAGAVFKAAPGSAPPGPREIDTLRDGFRSVFTLDGAGGALVLPPGLEMDFPGAGPERLALASLAETPGHRILAALGLSAMAVGLPDANKTYSNLAEALDSAWENCVLPLKRACAAVVEAGIKECLPGLGEFRLVPDVAAVRALQDDEAKNAERAARLFEAGVVDRYQAQQIAGLEPDPQARGEYAGAAGGGQGAAKSLVAAMLGRRRG